MLTNKQAIKTSVIGFIANLVLAVIKLVAGTLAQSTALIADGVNSFSDSLNSIISIFSLFYSARPADDKHPYGHERMEIVGGFLVTLVMGYLGIDLLITSIQKMMKPLAPTISTLTFMAVIISILFKGILAYYYYRRSVVTQTKILLVNAKDSLYDVFISLTVLVAIFIEKMFELRIDAYLSSIIALFIIYSSYQLIRNFVDELVGLRPDEALLKDIETLLEKENRILGYHDILVHNYGKNRVYASVDVELDQRLSLIKAHDIIDSIESKIFEKHNVQLSIHLDPINLDDEELLIVNQVVNDYLTQYYPAAEFHDLRRNNGKVFRFELVLVDGEKELTKIKSDLLNRLSENDVSGPLEIFVDEHQISSDNKKTH